MRSRLDNKTTARYHTPETNLSEALMRRLKGTVTLAQAQGPRDFQEDCIVHVAHSETFWSKKTRGHLIGILDGHISGEVSEYCARRIPDLFEPEENAAESLDRLILKLDRETEVKQAGTTISLAWIDEIRHTVTTTFLGDSPILIIDREGFIRRSETHDVWTNATERQKVIERGGYYFQGYVYHSPREGGLALSRALGDSSFRKILSQTPTSEEYKLGVGSAVLIASDGLFNSTDEDTSKRDTVATMMRSGKSADEILLWRKKEMLKDNTSLIVWRSLL